MSFVSCVSICCCEKALLLKRATQINLTWLNITLAHTIINILDNNYCTLNTDLQYQYCRHQYCYYKLVTKFNPTMSHLLASILKFVFTIFIYLCGVVSWLWHLSLGARSIYNSVCTSEVSVSGCVFMDVGNWVVKRTYWLSILYFPVSPYMFPMTYNK